MRAIRDRLRLVYGRPLAEPHGHPIAELVLTVLSQSTNDRNRDVAYLALRERFPGDTWVLVRDAPVDEVEEAIRPGGISKVKSARIKAILRAITDAPRPTVRVARRVRPSRVRASRVQRRTTPTPASPSTGWLASRYRWRRSI